MMFQVTIWDTRRGFEAKNKPAVNKAIHQEFPGVAKLCWIEQSEIGTWTIGEGHKEGPVLMLSGDPLAIVKEI